MTISSDDGLILIAAFRYALGRQSYVVKAVAERVLRDWPELTQRDRDLIRREIKTAISDGRAGSEMDIKQWLRISTNVDGM